MEIEYTLFLNNEEVENMEQDLSTLEMLVNNVPTDVSGKWVKKEELYTFAAAVADFVLTKMENNLNDTNLQANSN
ncbi:hypothetical protein UFOVP242_206 [uncultured Caudovirales phage]|uniref:Uncharacterized protein n=1 Tax=uncultured Caudovirales phage TaxID=2100421 RepID=A0A6J7WZ41_9CAUD|nr:hypothetical protein UFOVP242_206 [uncultured Caudovirales phage]